MRTAYFSPTDAIQVPVFRRSALAAGAVIDGPAVIEEKTSTTVLYPGQRAAIDGYLNIADRAAPRDHSDRRFAASGGRGVIRCAVPPRNLLKWCNPCLPCRSPSPAASTIACSPLQTGEIKPDGIDLNFLVMDNPREIFDRMSNRLEFDACEMSSSEFVTRYAAKKLPFVALPVFASRVFRHGFIVVNRKHIKSAKDLAGKRVGVPLYTQTAAIFIRGLMQHDLGIDLDEIEWVQGAINEPGAYGNPSVMPMLKPVNIKPNNSGKSLSDLLEAGEIHAIVGSNMPRALGRHPDVVRLFPDYRAKEKDYYRRTKIFPIMHLVVIRNDVYEKNPFVATSLYDAFNEAKDCAREKMRYSGTLRYMLPWLPDDVEEIDELFGGDCWPYGIEPNRPTLEALVTYMVEQGLIPEPIPIEKLFVPTFG